MLLLRVDGLDVDVLVFVVRTPDGLCEVFRSVRCDLDARLAHQDLDLADRALRDVAAAAQQWDEPLRVGVLRAADVDGEPHATGILATAELATARVAVRAATFAATFVDA